MNSTPKQLLSMPPLENGDRLSRFEFERRYQAMPHLKKAKLVEGVVHMAAALRIRSHGQPRGRLATWLGTYEAFTSGVVLGIEPTVRLDLENEPQPDAVLLVPGRQARIGEDDYIEGAPELVVEVAASSAAFAPACAESTLDLHERGLHFDTSSSPPLRMDSRIPGTERRCSVSWMAFQSSSDTSTLQLMKIKG